jgi:23S rRNA (pseudouridine1915-N3)-methyltransferase
MCRYNRVDLDICQEPIIRRKNPMFRLNIRAIGSPSEEWHQQAIHSYQNRLKPYALLETLELPEGHGKTAKPDLAKTRAVEATSLLKNLPAGGVVIALDETGKEFDSPGFAKELEHRGGNGQPVTFLIGGSWGLDPSVRERADLVLSLGKITLPHSLARIVLLEQLYRATTILGGKTYHK